MKIIVPIKRVVDHQLRVKVRPDGEGLDLEGLKFSINPFDEIALEEALRLREAGRACEVLVVGCGPAVVQENLRTALALGADRAILLETSIALQPLGAAKLLKALALREAPELILMGKQAIDDDACQTGQMLAAMLGWPQGCFVSKLQAGAHSVQVTREVDGGMEVLELGLPAVLTVDLRLNEPRYVSLANVMKARKQAIEVLPAESLSADLQPRLKTLHYAPPQPRAAGRKLGSVAELLEILLPYRAAQRGEQE